MSKKQSKNRQGEGDLITSPSFRLYRRIEQLQRLIETGAPVWIVRKQIALVVTAQSGAMTESTTALEDAHQYLLDRAVDWEVQADQAPIELKERKSHEHADA